MNARRVLSVLTLGFFALLGAGSNRRSGAPPPPPVVRAVPVVAPPPVAQIPDSSTWSEHYLPDARVRLRVPPGATLGIADFDDELNHGPYFEVKFPGGHTERFDTSPRNLDEIRADLPTRRSQYVALYSDPDTLVHQAVEAPYGQYCSTDVCKTVGAWRICSHGDGVHIDEHDVQTRLTPEQCLQMVAIARSIEAL